MSKIQIFCKDCKKFMLIEIDYDIDLGQDMIPSSLIEDLDDMSYICEHCGVLHRLKVTKCYRVDAEVIF
jgi:RNase P subunit RPR2